jgi:hypothetical protein
MKRQIDAWKGYELPDLRAKEVICKAFIEGDLEIPKHLAKHVHQNYFASEVPELPAAHDVVLVQRFHKFVEAPGPGSRKCRQPPVSLRSSRQFGGSIFRDKWGTPDVVGIREPKRGDIVKFRTEIVSAEVKVESAGLITAFV